VTYPKRGRDEVNITFQTISEKMLNEKLSSDVCKLTVILGASQKSNLQHCHFVQVCQQIPHASHPTMQCLKMYD